MEVVGLSTTDYRNQEALNKALNIYRTYMRSFIIFHLKKIPRTNVEDTVINSVSEWRADEIERSLADRDIKSIIDIDDFPRLVRGKKGENWKEVFRYPLNDDEDFQNQLWLIKSCRDQSWAHPPEGDAESEGTRAYLFLIADVLRKIKKPDKQSEIEAIRDELFSDDTAERLEKAEEDNVEYKRSLAETEQRLATAESEKNEYAEENAVLSKQVDKKENQRKKLDKQLKRAKAQNDKYKKDIAGTKQRLEESEAAQTDYKKRFETTSKELIGTHAEWKETEKHLATALNQLAAAQAAEKGIAARLRALQSLFTVAAIGEQEVQEVFQRVFQRVYPPIETDSAVRILDRRDVNKKNYLLELLEQRQPTLIYVQSEEMVDLLLERVLPEKADLIEKHGEQTSEAEEAEILEKLENRELIAVVSNTTFSALDSSHCVEHFVFCHLAPGIDEFFKQCEPAFTPGKNAYLHLIYNSNQDIESLDKWLTQKYPDRKVLKKMYRELEKLIGVNGDFIKPEKVYNELDMAELGITELGLETGFAIFEEVGALERNKDGIKLSPFSGRKSEIYHRGEELQKGIGEVRAFQLEQPIEQIWEEIQEKLDVDGEQILREVNTDEMYSSVSEMENDQQRTETVENGGEPDDADIEANQAPKTPRANATVPEEQFREIQSRSAAGESNSELAKEFDLSPTAIRFVAEKTEGTRNEIAVKVVELRINKEGSKPIAWKNIREKLGLHNDHFHKVIRLSEGYREAVIERIKKLRAQDGGWEYNGKLSVLTGIEDIENYLE